MAIRGEGMTKHVLAGVVVVLALAAVAAAQRSTKPGPVTATKEVVISGEVRDQGKSLVSNEINKWTVENSEALKVHDGDHVTAKCRVDPDHHTIHVLAINPREADTRTARIGDSAFRR